MYLRKTASGNLHITQCKINSAKNRENSILTFVRSKLKKKNTKC